MINSQDQFFVATNTFPWNSLVLPPFCIGGSTENLCKKILPISHKYARAYFRKGRYAPACDEQLWKKADGQMFFTMQLIASSIGGYLKGADKSRWIYKWKHKLRANRHVLRRYILIGHWNVMVLNLNYLTSLKTPKFAVMMIMMMMIIIITIIIVYFFYNVWINYWLHEKYVYLKTSRSWSRGLTERKKGTEPTE